MNPRVDARLRTANLTVLLVSASYLASYFVDHVEVLQRANKNTFRLHWIAVEDSLVSETQLIKFQAVNNPRQPFDTLANLNMEIRPFHRCLKVTFFSRTNL
jgi:hypothetical protein